MDDPLPAGLVEEWQSFLKGASTLDKLFEHNVLFPLQRKAEMEKMHSIARKAKPHTVMEIGADKGGSVWAWCKELPTVRRVIACEIRGTPYSKEFEKAFPEIEFLWLPESSYAPDSVLKVRQWLGYDPLDVLFIDGDKSRFQLDYDVYTTMMRSGGIVFIHDVVDHPMSGVFQHCRKYKKWDHVVDVSEVDPALRRGREGIPSSCRHEDWLRFWKGRSCTVGVIYQ